MNLNKEIKEILEFNEKVEAIKKKFYMVGHDARLCTPDYEKYSELYRVIGIAEKQSEIIKKQQELLEEAMIHTRYAERKAKKNYYLHIRRGDNPEIQKMMRRWLSICDLNKKLNAAIGEK